MRRGNCIQMMALKRKNSDSTSEEKRKWKTFTLEANHEIIKRNEDT